MFFCLAGGYLQHPRKWNHSDPLSPRHGPNTFAQLQNLGNEPRTFLGLYVGESNQKPGFLSERCEMDFVHHSAMLGIHLSWSPLLTRIKEWLVITQNDGVIDPFLKGQKETPSTLTQSLLRTTQAPKAPKAQPRAHMRQTAMRQALVGPGDVGRFHPQPTPPKNILGTILGESFEDGFEGVKMFFLVG